jgi:Uma2 family endonuclease
MEGAPKVIIEGASPSSKFIDLYQKKGEYYQLGVQEYWIVISEREVQVNIWDEDRYIEKTFSESKDGLLKVPVHLEGWDLMVEIDSNRIPEGIVENACRAPSADTGC